MSFDIKLFFFLVLGFIITTVVGTLTHEFGHYSMAEYLGYEAFINYKSTNFDPNQNMSQEDEFWIVLAGSAQTILTGTIGLVILLVYRKSYVLADKLLFKHWIFIFVALFWLRQLSNFALQLYGYWKNGEFSLTSDEMKIDAYLHFQTGSTSTISAIFATAILLIIVFKFIPKYKRFIFLLAGFFGGLSGYYLWMHSVGVLILP